MRRVLPLLLALLALPPSPGRAEDGPCSACKGTGEVACAKHKALNVADLKVGEFLCADCLDLDCCHGIGWNACAKCKDPKAAAKWKDGMDRRKGECARILKLVEGGWFGNPADLRFVQERKDRDARKKGPKHDPVVPRVFLNVLEYPVIDATKRVFPQVYFMTDMPARRVTLPGQKNLTPLDQHQSQHLYLSRILEVFHEVEDLHRPGAFDPKKDASKKPEPEIHPKEMAGIDYTMFIFANEEAQRRIRAKLYEHEASGPSQGPNMAMAWESPGQFAQDKDLHQWVFAATAGGMLHQYNDDPARTPEQRKDDAALPEWLEQGFTHVLEMRRWGVCEEAPVAETKKTDPKRGVEAWVPDKWPQAVLKLIQAQKARGFSDLTPMVLDDMRCSDHQVAWSYVDFLLHKGMDKLARLVPLLRKKGVKQAEALREVYGLTQGELENEWKAYALKSYAR